MTDSSQQVGDSFRYFKNRTVMKQFCWYMIWPLMTVLLVSIIFYLDRMYTFKAQTIQQENIRIASLQVLLQDRNRSIVSDLQFLGDNRVLQDYLQDSSASSPERITLLIDRFLAGKKFYTRVRLLNLNGKELIGRTNAAGHTDGIGHNVDDFETPHLFKSLLEIEPEMLYLLSTPAEQSGGSSSPVKADSLQRYYFLVQDDNGGPAGFISLDYDKLNLLATPHFSNGDRLSRIFLLENGAEGGIAWQQSDPDSPGTNSGGDADDAEIQGVASNLSDNLFKEIAFQPIGHFSQDGNLYVFHSINPLPPVVVDLHMADSKYDFVHVHGQDEPDHWLLMTEVPGVYFDRQKRYYIKLLSLLGLLLLVPSLFFCLFLARTKARAERATALRYRENLEHLDQLEVKVRQRTQDLDDSNLKLTNEIAERLTVEKQLRLNNELLSGMIGSIDGIIYVADFASHEILFANDYLKQLFGFDPVGRLCWQFLHANQDGPCSFCSNCRLLDDKGTPATPLQWEYQNPYNKKWYSAKDQAILWSNGKYVRLEIAIDITEQKRLQHFLQEARKQAELATGVRSRFVALVAHDLKSPFFSITQMLKRILDRETFTHEVHRQFLENIVENGHRMLQMIDNLLSMDRFETGEIKLERRFFDVSGMADEVLQNFKHPAMEKDLTLCNNIPPGTMLYADKYLYYVVLNNLLSNAIKFSERNGHIILSGAVAMGPATIKVEDNGKGMSREYAENLFKADVKTSSQGTYGEKGSGLGLIFCQDIMKAHDGIIHVETEVGVGTSFYLKLPECCSVDRIPTTDEQISPFAIQ